MQIQLPYADAIIGSASTNNSYIRTTRGATITITESRSVPGDVTVEIHGSASQVWTAQQLIQVWLGGSINHKHWELHNVLLQSEYMWTEVKQSHGMLASVL